MCTKKGLQMQFLLLRLSVKDGRRLFFAALLIPKLVGGRLPAACVVHAFSAQALRALRCFEVGGNRARFAHHLLQKLRIFKRGAGVQVVVVKRLPFVIFQEKRLLQALQKRLADYISAE